MRGKLKIAWPKLDGYLVKDMSYFSKTQSMNLLNLYLMQ